MYNNINIIAPIPAMIPVENLIILLLFDIPLSCNMISINAGIMKKAPFHFVSNPPNIETGNPIVIPNSIPKHLEQIGIL